MIVVEGTFRAPNIETALPAMVAMIVASRAESGCIEYAYALDIFDPTLVRVIERWESREALAAHIASEHLKAWRNAWGPLGIAERSLRLYEADAEDF